MGATEEAAMGERLAAQSREIRLLRKENAKIRAEYEDVRGRLERDNAKLHEIVAEMAAEMAALRGRLAAYDNAHTSSPSGSIQKARKRAAARDGGGPAGNRGARKGHKGASHGRRSTDRRTRRAGRCRCGSRRIRTTRIIRRQVTDIKSIPEVVTWTEVIHVCTCSRCGREVVPRSAATRGTSLGPHLLAIILKLWQMGGSIRPIRMFLTIFGFRPSAGAVYKATRAIADALDGEYRKMCRAVNRAGKAGADETPYIMNGRRGYVWAVKGGNSVRIHAAPSRGSAVFDSICGNRDRPFVTDRYAVYDALPVHQWCWAHILREAEWLNGEGAAEEGLHRRLQDVMHRAKNAAPGGGASAGLAGEIAGIAAEYTRLGHKYGAKLATHPERLLTFVENPGLDPTNNACEQVMRWVVMQRRTHQRLDSPDGRRIFSVLMTCLCTWKLQGRDPAQGLLEVLRGT